MNQTGIAAMASDARRACRRMAALDTDTKNNALLSISAALLSNQEAIFAANNADVRVAGDSGLAAPLLKRLVFNEAKLSEVTEGIASIIALSDPVGKILSSRVLDTGLDLYQVSCPIGLIAMIFESRPDALVQIAALALKSGNCLILKGGSEARESNRILADTVYNAGLSAGLPEHWLVLIESRAEVAELFGLHGIIDLIIPRGSNEFVQYIMKNTLIPVMGHADGICHVYIDETADIDVAKRIVVDSKTQYVAVCNAAETLLVHDKAATRLLPAIARALAEKNVELHASASSAAILDSVGIKSIPANEKDWEQEYLDYAMSVKTVKDLDEAIEHINAHGSHHTDAIVTQDAGTARTFMQEVDSASVLWNASTRFADGFRYGLGAEVGISTGKLHARGPVGLEGLVTYKYKIFGNGQIVADYAGKDAKHYIHKTFASEQEPWK